MNSELKKAAVDGDVMSLQKHMASNNLEILEKTDDDKNTALHIAASEGHVWFVHHFLIFMNLNPELVTKKNKDGNTPVHLAVRAGHLDVVQHLIQYVAWARNMKKISEEPFLIKNNNGNTLLHESLKHQMYNVAIKLLEAAMDVTIVGTTPEAVYGMNVKDVRKDVRIDHVLLYLNNVDGDTPLHLAVRGGHLQGFEHLIQYVAITMNDNLKELLIMKNKNGNTLLLESVIHHRYDKAIKLLEHAKEASLLGRTLEEKVGLRVVDVNVDVRMDYVLLILSNGDGDTPLFLAERVGHLQGFERLVRYVARATEAHTKESLIMKNKSGNTLLFESVIHQRYDKAIKLLEQAKEASLLGRTLDEKVGLRAVDVNVDVRMDDVLLLITNGDGDTPLHQIVKHGHVDGSVHLIEHVARGRNIQKNLKDPILVQNNKHNTLLHESVIHSRCDVATKLLASAKEVTLKGSTLEAIVGMHIEDAKEVVRMDHALLLLWNAEKHTPLHMAVKGNNFEMVELLIKYDQEMKHGLISAKQMKEPKNMDTALKEAAEEGSVERLTKIILDNSKPPETIYDTVHSVTQDERNTVLHIAASRGHELFIERVLLLKNMDIELLVLSENADGDIPLHLAVKAGHLSIIERLFQHVALAREIQSNLQEPLIMINKEGNTLLHEAVIKGLYNVADVLLEYCRVEGKWSTPKAILKEHNEYVDHDIKINDVLKIWGPVIIGNNEGNNPLHVVVMSRMSDMALKMLDAIPRCGHVPNMEMQSPLYIAVMNGLDHVINKIAKQELLVASISISIHGTAVHQAVLADNIRALEILLSKYVMLLDVPDKDGNSALHYAAKTNKSRMISMLLKKDKGLAYKLNTNQGRSALHVATEYGSLEAINGLLKHRPDLSEMVDITGQNVFHIAVQNNRVNVLKWLLQWLPGDLVNRGDNDGNTPLHLATKWSSVEQALLLLKDPRVDPCIVNKHGETAFAISDRMGLLDMLADEFKLWKKLKKCEYTRCKKKRQGRQFPYAIDLRTYVLVATLIAMATFMATLRYSRQSSFADVRHHLAFRVLVVCNAISVCSSTAVIMFTTWQSWNPVKVKSHVTAWASNLIILAGLMMIMSMLTIVYLTVEPVSPWLSYLVISIGITSLFLYYCLVLKKRIALQPLGFSMRRVSWLFRWSVGRSRTPVVSSDVGTAGSGAPPAATGSNRGGTSSAISMAAVPVV